MSSPGGYGRRPAVPDVPRHEISVDSARTQVKALQRLIESALEDVGTEPDAPKDLVDGTWVGEKAL